MTRSIHEPSHERLTASNRFQVKEQSQKPHAGRWITPDCTPGSGGGACFGDEPPLQNNWQQPTGTLETFAFRKHMDGSLEFKGHLDASGGAVTGTVAFTLPGVGAGEPDYLLANDQWWWTVVTTDDGTTFEIGLIFVSGSTGEVWIYWPVAQGPAGDPGSDGSDGSDGATVFFVIATPGPGTGNDGDIAIDSNTWNVYQKTAGAWSLIGNISSTTNNWLSGTGVPSGVLGSDNDFYLDVANGNVYQKISGSWTLVGNIKGPTGTAGGAITIPYTFSTTTTDSDPGNGIIRLSNATQNLSTVIRADLLANDATTWTTVLDSFDDSTNTVKGHIRLFKQSDPSIWMLFTVSAVATPSGYRNITVAPVSASSASPFSNGDALNLCFTRAGDSENRIRDVEIVFDGNGLALTAGIKGDIALDFPSTIVGWTLLADQSGSVVIDIWKDVYANYPPTVADTITASAKPTLSGAVKNLDTTLTGWITSIAAGDTLRFNIDSASTVIRVTLALKLQEV